MPTDLQIALLLQSQYNGETIFDYQDTVSEVTFAVKCYPDCNVVLFEGSHNAPDWEHDFEALMIHPIELKGAAVHSGFWEGLREAFVKILPYLAKDKLTILCGHSLGAGRVNLAAGLLLHYQFYNVRRVKFASPRSNDKYLAKLLVESPLTSYINYHDEEHHDFVCDVPRCIPIIADYDTREPKILIDVPPQADDTWGFLAWHHLFLYIEGIQNGKS